MNWIDTKQQKPTPIPDDDSGMYPCNPNESVICAIWRGWDDPNPRLIAWAKQRYCADGQWRNDREIGFVPTHWMPTPPMRPSPASGKQPLTNAFKKRQLNTVSVRRANMQTSFKNDFIHLRQALRNAYGASPVDSALDAACFSITQIVSVHNYSPRRLLGDVQYQYEKAIERHKRKFAEDPEKFTKTRKSCVATLHKLQAKCKRMEKKRVADRNKAGQKTMNQAPHG